MSESKQRVCLVYGSQFGNVQRTVEEVLAKWQEKLKGKDAPFVLSEQALEGNDAGAALNAESLAQDYDILVIFTSSYAKGDPPEGFGRLLWELYQVRSTGNSTRLAGMQHALLGFGDKVYKSTFQNNPRLTDKMMEENGSRRFHASNHEIDASSDNQEDLVNQWTDSVFEQLMKTPKASDPPVPRVGEPLADKEPAYSDEWDIKPAVSSGSNMLPFILLLLIVLLGLSAFFQKSGDL
mmetsp:Transcript_2693/g.3067  ORF Transcript_2693/g.3067 Transcript_2693/m.3067 type:complete len:237 (+) Transcript_2693:211-921(+)|eukprot:CAMPEP_0197859562 /NCGR_PEP_ID=MMETSP1438-20131217/34203_1 /TAXON_ID=1461541 /ORGANISM="Pterosperma sp., Strain CCMP1384" /LENGTH=236 /DNA_ID=CAMNT_0043476091 /DNA_START=204 /DNA_END=914 /DNA_ORIENTATION=+